MLALCDVCLSHGRYHSLTLLGVAVIIAIVKTYASSFSSKDEKLIIDFCVFNCAVMGQILVNGTLLL